MQGYHPSHVGLYFLRYSNCVLARLTVPTQHPRSRPKAFEVSSQAINLEKFRWTAGLDFIPRNLKAANSPLEAQKTRISASWKLKNKEFLSPEAQKTKISMKIFDFLSSQVLTAALQKPPTALSGELVWSPRHQKVSRNEI